MYLAIDVGGTKTLFALFDNEGNIIEKNKFPTAQDYPKFLDDLKNATALIKVHQVAAVCCAIPAIVDRQNGVGLAFGRLPWKNVPIRDDLEDIFNGAKVFVENDAKLAGLSEALLVHDRYKNVLYLTIGTGIGDGIITDGKIDVDYQDSEAGQMVLEHKGQMGKWEDMASGKTIVKLHGQKAKEISDPKIWQDYVGFLAPGIDPLVATLQPDVIIVGGGVGAHFEKFESFLNQELLKYENNMIKMPPIIKAKRPEEAVIYGCYD